MLLFWGEIRTEMYRVFTDINADKGPESYLCAEITLTENARSDSTDNGLIESNILKSKVSDKDDTRETAVLDSIVDYSTHFFSFSFKSWPFFSQHILVSNFLDS